MCFVDFKKAYDSVPHEALLYKMRTMGIGGKVYAFIEKLYAHSAIVVDANGYTSEPIPLERGLRQGCPLSPILFSLFINTSSSPYSSTTSSPSSLKENPGNLPAPTSSSRMTCASWGGVRRSCSDGWTR